jgi:hypothetical protein
VGQLRVRLSITPTLHPLQCPSHHVLPLALLIAANNASHGPRVVSVPSNIEVKSFPYIRLSLLC